jgi:hypothetical protein
MMFGVATPLWRSVRMTLTLPKWGLGSPLGLPKIQSSIVGVGKVLKCTCRKLPRMNHSDICSIGYVQKKGWESNWQFDPQPLKVWNQPDPGVCRWKPHCWKGLNESYKFALDLIPIGGLRKEVELPKSWESKLGQFQDSSLWVPGKSAIRM